MWGGGEGYVCACTALCVYFFSSLLPSGSGYEVGGEGEEVERISLKYVTEAAVMGGVRRYMCVNYRVTLGSTFLCTIN